MLATIRKTAQNYLFNSEDWPEYYKCLVLYLLGALKFKNLDKMPEAPLPKQVAFWGAATVVELLTNPPPPPDEPPEYDYDVFISYSHTDQDWMRGELLPRLEAVGLKVCIDFRDFDPGAPRPTEVERAVLTSRKTLLVLTSNYLESEWDEFGNLMLQTLDPASRQRRLIPLLKAPCYLPLRLRFLVPVDFVEPADWDIAWTRLLRALHASAT